MDFNGLFMGLNTNIKPHAVLATKLPKNEKNPGQFSRSRKYIQPYQSLTEFVKTILKP